MSPAVVLVNIGASIDFFNGSDATQVCTHATLRFTLEKLPPKGLISTFVSPEATSSPADQAYP